ncbi:MAG: RNA polymerase sigma factor [Acidimicrobiales bacterium]
MQRGAGRPPDPPDRELDDLRPALHRVLAPEWDRAIAARDQAALDRELTQAWEVVHRYVAARVGRDRAEELTQEVFCRVLSRLGRAEGDEAVRQAYLVQSAKNLLRDHWRSTGRRAALAPPAPSHPAEVADPAAGPEDQAVGRSEEESLRRALGRLAGLQREVLRRRIVEGQSAEEVGEALGRRAETIRQIQHRALRTLRELLEAEELPS